MRIRSFLSPLAAGLLLCLVACAQPTAAPQPAAEAPAGAASVLLVPIDYRDGRWLLGEAGVTILPCPPPGPVLPGQPDAPLIRILNAEGKAVLEQLLAMDPRIVLPEDAAFPPYLKQVSITLRLPYAEGMQRLDFYETPKAEGQPSLSVDLSRAASQYREKGGLKQEATCKEPQFKPDALK